MSSGKAGWSPGLCGTKPAIPSATSTPQPPTRRAQVVSLAGRCAERLVLGEAQHSTSGGADLASANRLARSMVYRGGYGARMGPVALEDDEENYLRRES